MRAARVSQSRCVVMVLSTSLLKRLSMTHLTMLAAGNANTGSDRRRRPTQVQLRSRWIPSTARLPRRRSSSVILSEPWMTGLSKHHQAWLAGSCLSHANSGLHVRLPATQSGQRGCALGVPRRGRRYGSSCAPCCGEHGLARSLMAPLDLHSHLRVVRVRSRRWDHRS